jgi:hypothetical protein
MYYPVTDAAPSPTGSRPMSSMGGGLPQPVGDGGVVGQVDHDPVRDVRFRSAAKLLGFRLGRCRWGPADLGAAWCLVRERGEYGSFESDDVSGVPDGLPGSVRCPAVVGDDRATGGNNVQVVLAEPDSDGDVGAGEPGRDGVVVACEGDESLGTDDAGLLEFSGERATGAHRYARELG